MSIQNNPAEQKFTAANQPALTGNQSDNPVATVTTPPAQAIQAGQAIKPGQPVQSGQDAQLSPTMPTARRAIVLLLIALGCSTAFVSFIIRGGLGLGMSLTILIAEVALWFYSAQHIDWPKKITALIRTNSGRRLLLLFYLTAVILFLGATYAIYSNMTLHFLNFLVIFALLIVQSLLLGIGNKQDGTSNADNMQAGMSNTRKEQTRISNTQNEQAGTGNTGNIQTGASNTGNEQYGSIQALNPYYASTPAEQVESINNYLDWDNPLFWLECVFSPFIRPFASLNKIPHTISQAWHRQQYKEQNQEQYNEQNQNQAITSESGHAGQTGQTGQTSQDNRIGQTNPTSQTSHATDGSRTCQSNPTNQTSHAGDKSRSTRRSHLVGQILLGLVLALPILLVAGSILASADAVFSSKMGQFLTFWRTMPLRDRLADLALICLFFPFIFSYLESCRTRWFLFIHQTPGNGANTSASPAGGTRPGPNLDSSGRSNNFDNNNPAINSARLARQTWPIHLKPVTMITILTSVNLLYLAFAIVQIAYLTGAFQFVLPESLTYAEYARQGFFELATMTPINIILMLFAIKGSIRIGLTGKILRVQSLILVAGSFIQWFSAIFRMQMYVQTYGLTLLRFFVTAFMLLMATIFIMMIIKEFRPVFPLFKTAAVATVLSLVILNAVNADTIIARHNLNHYLSGAGSTFDVQYYRDLSPAVLPVLIEALPRLDSASQQAVQTLLADRYQDLQHQTAGQNWLSYNQGISNAIKALETAGIQ